MNMENQMDTENRFMVREGDYLAVFNSAHRVMKAESVLKSLGFAILLIPAPRQLMTDCALALRISPDIKDDVLHALEQEQLAPALIKRFIGGQYRNEYEFAEDN